MTTSFANHEPDDRDSGPSRGLEDPRIIRPSPEDLLPGGVESQSDESTWKSDAPATSEEACPEDVGRGIVDPRNDHIGPDL